MIGRYEEERKQGRWPCCKNCGHARTFHCLREDGWASPYMIETCHECGCENYREVFLAVAESSPKPKQYQYGVRCVGSDWVVLTTDGEHVIARFPTVTDSLQNTAERRAWQYAALLNDD